MGKFYRPIIIGHPKDPASAILVETKVVEEKKRFHIKRH